MAQYLGLVNVVCTLRACPCVRHLSRTIAQVNRILLGAKSILGAGEL